jgi:hypothetical protein
MTALTKKTNSPLSVSFIFLWLTIFLKISINQDLFDLFVARLYNSNSGELSLSIKVHPSNYLLIFIFLFSLISGEIRKSIISCSNELKSLFHFFLATITVSALSVYFNGISGVGYLIETHIIASTLGIMTYICSEKHKGIIKDTILIFILLNSMLAFVEFFFHRHLIGYPQYTTASFFRSSAFLGHPLDNALITASAFFFIFSTKWNLTIKLLSSFFYEASLLCYGARTAVVISSITITIFLVVSFFKGFRKKTKYLELSAFIFFALIISLILFILIHDFGFGKRIFALDLFDESGAVRIKLFDIFHYVTNRELLTGISQTNISTLSTSLVGIQVIENFWVLFIILLGVPLGIFFIFFFVKMLFSLIYKQKLTSQLAAFTFILIASSNNSLASKSVSLTIIILLLVTSFQSKKEYNRTR